MQSVIDDIKNSTKPLKIFTAYDGDLKKLLNPIYSWVHSIQEIIFCVKNNIHQQPVCQLSTCNKIIIFSEANRKYNSGCCKSHSQMVHNYLNYGIETLQMSPESSEKRKKTFLEKYGVDNPMKHPIFVDKQQISVKLKYGFSTPILNKDIVTKVKNTCITKYGVDNPMKNKDIQNKLKNTNILKYGVSCVMNDETIQLKKQQSCFFNYGVKFPLQHSDILQQVKATKIIRYGVEFPFQSSHIQSKIAQSNATPSSSGEAEIVALLENIIKVKNDRSVLNGKELDIYLPGKKVALEFNGIYWHSELHGKDMNYHLNKTIKCEEQGIQLLHIFDIEWTQQREKVTSLIFSTICQFKETLHSEMCEVREIDNDMKNTFLEENHIQGIDTSTIKLGLFHNDMMLSIMTFCETSKTTSYELFRFCSKLHYNVIDAENTLLQYFKKIYNPVDIVTYVDRRYSNGSAYEKVGFKRVGTHPPEPFYIVNGQLERLNSTNTQCNKIWDCGTLCMFLNL